MDNKKPVLRHKCRMPV